ncbi:MAG: tRNA guanosine(15) transglycosylase TgtA [Candidatus Bathyarchaeia archaeon]
MFSFEVRERDLLARIGKLRTKSGVVETPVYLPVINPAKQQVSPREFREVFRCEALITNAYIMKKQFGDEPIKEGVHKFLDFPGVVMTDSGAYQILAYGRVGITPEEVIRYQEEIDTDIATILDLPTGWDVSKDHARYTVDETLKRARKLEDLKRREEIAWVGPVQGGRYLDLVALSAREMAKLPFQIHALGSPTPVMEQYLFDLLVDMILTAKMNLPPNRPLHLFGAGHPFMFSLAVALGCDLFDSAAYSIYAKQDRYMTEYRTFRLGELKCLPCSCPVCTRNDPKGLKAMPKEEREDNLARHNLYVCFSEMRRIKQAVIEGRLWEYLEMRAHGHPSLLQALRHLRIYSDYLEKHSPVSKRSGIFYFSSLGLSRPEITRYRKRVLGRYSPPEGADTLILLPRPRKGFYQMKTLYRRLVDKVRKLGGEFTKVHICIYSFPFGITPIELEDVYPLSQYEAAYPPDTETLDYVAEQIQEYIKKAGHERVIILSEIDTWEGRVAEKLSRTAEQEGFSLEVIGLKDELRNKDVIRKILEKIL